MQTVDHGWRSPHFVVDTTTWRPATEIVLLVGLKVRVVASATELEARWPDISAVPCGASFRIDTRVRGKHAVVRAVVADQSRRLDGSHCTMGNGVALDHPAPKSRGAAVPLAVETPILGFCIVARAPACNDEKAGAIRAALRARGLGSSFGILHVGNTFAFVNKDRSSAWLVDSPSFGGGEDGLSAVAKPNLACKISTDPDIFSACLVNTKRVSIGSLLWWAHGGGVNAEIKLEIAARKERAPTAAIEANKARKRKRDDKMVAARAAKSRLAVEAGEGSGG